MIMIRFNRIYLEWWVGSIKVFWLSIESITNYVKYVKKNIIFNKNNSFKNNKQNKLHNILQIIKIKEIIPSTINHPNQPTPGPGPGPVLLTYTVLIHKSNQIVVCKTKLLELCFPYTYLWMWMWMKCLHPVLVPIHQSPHFPKI